MADALIFSSSQIEHQSVQLVGGKASQLGKIPQGFWQIPVWYVLSAQAWEQQCIYTGWARTWPEQLEHLLSLPPESETFAELCEEKQLEIEDTPLIARIEVALRQWWEQVEQAKHGWAVRPSLAAGDTRRTSFAGVLERFLFQKDLPSIKNAIRRSWASAYSVKAMRYRLEHDIGLEDIRPAIILQHMIPSQLSGELFTANPLNGRRDEAKILAVGGIGDALQVGETQAETYILDLNSGDWKTHQHPFDPPVLDRKTTDMLMDMGEQLTIEIGSPLDIHWSMWEQELYVLHARPILQLPPPPYPSDTHIVWDQSLLHKPYRKICLPLSFSFLQYRLRSICEFAKGFGNPTVEQRISLGQAVERLTGLIGGRLFIHLKSWEHIQEFPTPDTETADGPLSKGEMYLQEIKRICERIDQKRFHRLTIIELMETIEQVHSNIFPLMWMELLPEKEMMVAKNILMDVYQEIFLEIGRRLNFDGLISSASDVYYLTLEELQAFCNGQSVGVQLKALTAIRKEEFETYTSQDWPLRFETLGPVYHHNSYPALDYDASAVPDPILNQWIFFLESPS